MNGINQAQSAAVCIAVAVAVAIGIPKEQYDKIQCDELAVSSNQTLNGLFCIYAICASAANPVLRACDSNARTVECWQAITYVSEGIHPLMHVFICWGR